MVRWEQDGTRPPIGRNAKTLAHMAEVIDALGDMIYEEDRLAFFAEPHPLLLNLPPIVLLGHDTGAKRVMEQVEAAATGTFG